MRTIFLALLFGGGLLAQNTPASPLKAVTVAPSGACPSNLAQLVGPGGTIYTCQNGTWGQVSGGGGGISGLTTTKIPKATSSTTIGDSALSDNGTTVTSTEPIAAPSASLGASPPAASVCTTTGSFLCVGEGAAPTGTLTGVDVLYPDSTAHRWKMINNNGTAQNVVGSLDVIPVASGGTGTASPALVPGTNVTITGAWPNQTINSSGGSGGGGTSGWGAAVLSLLSNATQYTPFVGGGADSTTESVVQQKSPATATISNLQVTLSASLGTGTTLQVTLRDGGSGTALTCTTASAGTTCSDTTHSLNIALGDLVDFQIVATGTVTAATPVITISYAVGTSGVGVTSGSAPIVVTGSTASCPSCIVSGTSTVASGAATTLSLSGIPAGNNLVITFLGRSTTSAANDFMSCFFNGDATAGHYLGTLTTWTNTSAGGTAASASIVSIISAATSTATFAQALTFNIPEFTNTTFGKGWSGTGGGINGTQAWMELYGGTWNQTSAITSISCSLVSGAAFVNGSTLRYSVQ